MEGWAMTDHQVVTIMKWWLYIGAGIALVFFVAIGSWSLVIYGATKGWWKVRL
jgi:hypothetical protein